ncbi:hypothetical protein PR202_gb04690 [Eleusine coracana subsp. coracana]|uniref:non-specific serine/threonine protein kinase n=1 Tax=Eleusine coracana subsp. coracana TaxID=191504 RepID=A0AAV5E552_ELECO|nr:hypothetical protein PR202_gb04690 [Eleusine coracana subsp. coracana]
MEKKDKDAHQVIMGGRYRLGRLLGRGNFAKVYKAHRTSTGEAVAIKVFDKEAARRSGTAGLVTREAGAMRRARHPHVVRLHEVMATRSRVYFAMEYAGGGELLERLARVAAGSRSPSRGATSGSSSPPSGSATAAACSTATSSRRTSSSTPEATSRSPTSGSAPPWTWTAGTAARGDALLHTACGTPAYVAPEVTSWTAATGARRWFLHRGPQAPRTAARPEPNTRITIAEIKAHPWFQKGASSSSCCPLTDEPLVLLTNTETGAPLLGKEACKAHHHRRDDDDDDEEDETRQRKRSKVAAESSSPRTSNAVTPRSMNAFDIIARSSGLDLSTMFDAEHDRSDEARFSITGETASAIVSRMEEIAEARGFSVTVKETGRVVMELEGRQCQDARGGALAVEAEIFEVAPSVHVVELRNAGGDSVGFREFCTRDLKPSLGDVVWSWQGGDSPPPSFVPAARAEERTTTDDC